MNARARRALAALLAASALLVGVGAALLTGYLPLLPAVVLVLLLTAVEWGLAFLFVSAYRE